MRCDVARPAISLAADGALDAADAEPLAAHLETCAACAAFEAGIARTRRYLRLEPLPPVPDVAPAVLRAIGTRRPQPPTPRRLTAAAVFAAAVVTGAAFVGVRGAPEAEADIPAQVLAAQYAVDSLTARLAITERGWHPDVPERTYTGGISYRAPESLAVHLVDGTPYPGPEWVPNHVDAVVDEARAWTRGIVPCPHGTQPECTPADPRVVRVTGREPFAADLPAPLDLVVPVGSFALAGEPVTLGHAFVGGRDAIGVRVPAAQVAALLSGLRPAGDWREIHPADLVELWLDSAALVPLRLVVFPGTDPERERWAAQRGYADAPGTPLLEVELSDVEVNGTVPGDDFLTAPTGTARDDGFTELPWAEVAAPVAGDLPVGLAPARAGVLNTPGGPEVGVRAWTDGRAWLKVRATREWAGDRLFGSTGDAVRPVALGAAGVAYLGEGGTTVALHAADLDIVVSGSVPEADLLAAAASLGVIGLPVPDSWDEASSVTLAEAAAALPGLLVPAGLDGFGTPALRLEAGVVTLTFAGPGTTGFVLAEAPGFALAPPVEPDVRGVQVRGTAGRYSFERGELEWVEDGIVVSLRSTTLGLHNLLAVAASLAAAPGH